MKRSKPCLPRKMKKAAYRMRMDTYKGKPFILGWFKPYPRTKWVVRMERQFIRTWTELQRKKQQVESMEQQIKIMDDVQERLNQMIINSAKNE